MWRAESEDWEMKVRELIEWIEKAPDAEVYIAGFCDTPEEANMVFFADEINSDGELSFCELGISLGEKAILICNEDTE